VKIRMFYARKKLAEFVQSLPSGAVH
jgi:hypothetical protein